MEKSNTRYSREVCNVDQVLKFIITTNDYSNASSLSDSDLELDINISLNDNNNTAND